MRQLLPLLVIMAVPALACVDVVRRETEMERTARALQEAADQCLLDVRDRGVSYRGSSNCTTRLDDAATAYVSFPSMKLTYANESVPRHAYIAESAKAVAWSAAAWSNAKFCDEEPVFSLW